MHDLGVNLEEVYAEYGGWIRRKVRRHLPGAWEDGVQEVLVKLQPALARLRETRAEAVRALVSRTVRSVCIDEIRRALRFPREQREVPPEDLPGGSQDQDHDQADDLARLATCWNELPERERRILKLRFHDGLSFREIAELLDVPQGSVAGWYSRAIAELRERLS